MKKFVIIPVFLSLLVIGLACRGTYPPTTPQLPTPTLTPTMTFTRTPSPTSTLPVTLTMTPTATPTLTITYTPTFTPTGTATYTPTFTPTLSISPTTTVPSGPCTNSFGYTCTPTPNLTLIPTGTSTQTPTSTPSPTATLSVTSTPTGSYTPSPNATLTGLDISGPATIAGGNYSYSYVHIYSTGWLIIDGPITFNLTNYFAMDAGASIGGYSDISTPGLGSPSNFASGAGAGHGGAGGADAQGNSGGPAYDNALAPTLPGSIGGEGSCGDIAYGGSIFQVNVVNGPATLNGFINVEGYTGSYLCSLQASGGGSGGTIFIQADVIEGNGTLWAVGGGGGTQGTYNGGGAGGGIIVLSTHTANNFTGTYSVQGGAASSPALSGQPGAFNQTTY